MLKQMEEHSLIVRALLADQTANQGMAWNTFKRLGLVRPNNTLNRALILSHLRTNHGAELRGTLGMGSGAFVYLMRLMLETV
jgi:hypothetical protein